MDAARAPIDRLCDHVPETIAEASGNACEECGSTVNVRLCTECGHLGCCESQVGHGRAHALAENHQVILQTPAGEGFAWCYAENRYL